VDCPCGGLASRHADAIAQYVDVGAGHQVSFDSLIFVFAFCKTSDWDCPTGHGIFGQCFAITPSVRIIGSQRAKKIR
jgi:hypothetical protein